MQLFFLSDPTITPAPQGFDKTMTEIRSLGFENGRKKVKIVRVETMSTASNGGGMNNGVDCHCGEEKLVLEPNDRIKKEAYLSSMAEYNAMYRESVDQPEAFWSRIADQFHWKQPWVLFSSLKISVYRASRGITNNNRGFL